MDDTIIIGTALILVSAICLKKRKTIKTRNFRVNPYLKGRDLQGRYNDFTDMKSFPPCFRENFHMTEIQFNFIFDKIEMHLKPVRNTRQDMIPPRAKLAMVLEYFACGSLQRHIASNYRVSKQAFSNIIDQVSTAICTGMGDEIPKLQNDQWLQVANKFNIKWQYPNCVGAIDGKHISIKCPRNAGSLFFNYKKFHSIVLMGVADADYKFLYIDVGAYGSEGDASVLSNTDFGRSIVQNTIELPEDANVGSINLPFVFVGDDAFPLVDRIIKPFSPPKGGTLTEAERIFNYRLSRARRCIENAFGILTTKFICLARPLLCSPERAQKIVAACCVLHNFFLNSSQGLYCPQNFVDHYDENGHLVQGNWRQMASDMTPLDRAPLRQIRSSERAKKIRDIFKEFFNSVEGSLSWQRKSVFLE